jgi:hypothetical protein
MSIAIASAMSRGRLGQRRKSEVRVVVSLARPEYLIEIEAIAVEE